MGFVKISWFVYFVEPAWPVCCAILSLVKLKKRLLCSRDDQIYAVERHYSMGGVSSVASKYPPLNWKVGFSIHGHWVNRRNASSASTWHYPTWDKARARAFTATSPTKSKYQASARRQLSSPKTIKKKNIYIYSSIVRNSHHSSRYFLPGAWTPRWMLCIRLW